MAVLQTAALPLGYQCRTEPRAGLEPASLAYKASASPQMAYGANVVLAGVEPATIFTQRSVLRENACYRSEPCPLAFTRYCEFPVAG